MTHTISYQTPIVPKNPRPYQNKNIETTDTTMSKSLEKLNAQETSATDTVTFSQQTAVSETYSRPSIAGQNASEDGFDLLRGLVANLLKEQGIDYKIANAIEEMDITQLSPEKARALIADDGYFGVAQTSDRIADFAIALAGGDPGRLAVLQEGVEQGFSEASDALGGWLPDISNQTHDAVMQKLDAWAQQGGA
ncbi:MAG: hypothetical protein EHM45_20920 [Desulfobacteraceae bacterium]|nr:MAG: hypothetical protein EHM45_20920 [Desulfobacteraceae bacterium]